MKPSKNQPADFILHSYFRYFSGIILILLVFFILFRGQLRKTYYEAQDIRIHENLEILQNNINDQFSSLFQLHVALQKNMNLNALRRSGSNYYRYMSLSDMRAFALSNNLVSDIIYLDFTNQTELSCFSTITKRNNTYYLYTKPSPIPLPIKEYGHLNIHSFVYVSKDGSGKLLCFPSLINQKYSLFFVINTETIMNQLAGILSDTMVAACLTDSDGHMIDGIYEERFHSCAEKISRPDEKIGKKDLGNEVIYTLTLYEDLYLSILFSKDLLVQYASIAFRSTLAIMLFIGALILILVYLYIKKTYIPLRQLVQKVSRSSSGSIIEQLDSAFTNTMEHNRELQDKIKKYHNMMKESILNAITGDTLVPNEADINRLLSTDLPHTFYIAVFLTKGTADNDLLLDTISVLLGENSLLLKKNEEGLVLLLSFSEDEDDKCRENDLEHILLQIYDRSGQTHLTALSQGSSSPLDIPRLYENAADTAGRTTSQAPVCICQEPHSINHFPYQKLNLLSGTLKSWDFEAAKELLDELLSSLDAEKDPDFYIRSILIDITTVIISEMNQADISFKLYNNDYFETLYLCRSQSYKENSSRILGCLHKLIDLFAEYAADSSALKKELQKILAQEYTSPDLSISLLADHFHISTAYMSTLFKKYYGQNFSDHLWTLRLEKAKELLQNTEESIDHISMAVGYENTSSFRRRFKKETGITPAQFREASAHAVR